MLLKTRILGVEEISSQPYEDERGSFRELVAGVEGDLRLCEAANTAPRTLRGMHFQDIADETKYVWCTKGALWDVALDIRPGSATWGCSVALDLVPGGAGLLVPPGVAHGYITLEPNTVVLYLIKGKRHAGAQQGVRWNDPRFNIPWVETPRVISDRDANWPLWSERC